MRAKPKVGQKVLVLQDIYDGPAGSKPRRGLVEQVVSKIGTSYFYVKSSMDDYFESRHSLDTWCNSKYLGYSSIFDSEQEYADSLEHAALAKSVAHELEHGATHRFTLDQFRRVNAILQEK